MNKITEAMVDAAWQAFGDCPIDMCGDHDEEQKKCVVAAVEAALSAGQAQPVGYVTKNEFTKLRLGVSCVDLFGNVVPAGFEMVPLYTHPPAVPWEVEPVRYCQPNYDGKIHPNKFMVVYEDAEMGNAVFDDEAEAREHFEKASISWNCYLFGLMPRAAIPVPRGGIEPDWHAASVLMRRRFRKLEKAARRVIEETDRIHDNDPWPVKYRAPYEAITALRELLPALPSAKSQIRSEK